MLKLYLLFISVLATMSGTANNLYYDARSVHDMAQLRFDAIASDPLKTWALVRIVAEPHSGSATIPGAYVEAETGRVVIPPGDEKATVIIKEGSWEVIASLQEGNPPSPKAGKYSWTEPLVKKRKLDPEDVYSAFGKSGILLSRLNPEAKDAKKFEPSYLIPTQWENAILPAYQQFKTNSGLFNGQLSRTQTNRVAQLLRSDNPILSAMAFRRLIETEKLDEESIISAVQQADGHKKAVYIYVLLTRPENAKEDAVLNLLKHVAESAKGADDLRSIALGSFAAAVFASDSKNGQALGRQLLATLRERSKEINAESDEYLQEIFRVAGAAN